MEQKMIKKMDKMLVCILIISLLIVVCMYIVMQCVWKGCSSPRRQSYEKV